MQIDDIAFLEIKNELFFNIWFNFCGSSEWWDVCDDYQSQDNIT